MIGGNGVQDDVPQGDGHGESGKAGHVTVLLEEVIGFLEVQRGGFYIDATLGLGGHSYEIAKRLGRQGRLTGFDKDEAALQSAGERLQNPPPELAGDWPQIKLVHASFAEVARHAAPAEIDGLVADLGVSSMQLGNAARGFSFQADGPLDMRMDTQAGQTAEQVVNQLDEESLADLIYEFGDERRSRRIARAIVRARPVHTTAHLAQVISAAARPMKSREKKPGHSIHPATLTFQAIRIFVNRELEDLEELLRSAPGVLKTGGRMAVISFHSLEDRRVKDAFRLGGQQGTYEVLTRKPVTASPQEVRRNPRSRSAKLRAVARLAPV